MARSKKPFALLVTCSVVCVAAACGDGEDSPGGTTAGTSSSGTAGSNQGGGNNGGKGGMPSAGTSNAGTAGTAPTAGTNPATGGMGGTMPSGDAGSGGDIGEPADQGGAGGDYAAAGSGGEGGEGSDDGPHQAPRLKYEFSENVGVTVADSSGRGLNATLTAAAWTATGRNGAGLGLTGAEHVTVPPGVFEGAKATTVAAWVKLNAGAQWARIFDFSNAGAGTETRFMYLAIDSPLGTRFSYFGGNEQNEATVGTGTVLPLNVWKHLAVTLSETGEQAIYIDGFPAVKQTTLVIPPSELEPMSAISYLGKSRFPDPLLNGALDEFVVYDRVLSYSEIAALAAPKGDYTRIGFDEAAGTAAADSSDRNVDATLEGGASWTAGRLGAAAQLSGETGQFVSLASNPLAGCTTEFTISLWVKHGDARPWARIFDWFGLSGSMFLTPIGTDGKLTLVLQGTARKEILGTKSVPVDNAWHHVAIVVNPSVASVYVDGELSGNAATPPTPADMGTLDVHSLGKSGVPTDAYFKGAFDEMRVACRAVSADEVKNLAYK